MSFKFTDQNLIKVRQNIKQYPPGKEKSAILFILSLAQEQNEGWLSKDSLEYIADFLSLPILKIYEIASFYSMYNLKKIGKYHLQICTNIVCMLRGSDKILNSCKNFCSKNKDFTLSEVECLGACVNSPVVQINENYYENLDESKISNILLKLNEQNFHKTVK
ncbi:MAG: NAD(P)H-dependent oxidoreductase subunit E [Rickettsia sp.]|nr:NAD(P)H-dependent oxidoreductase subunit E [Rickettsia sp.]